MSPREADDWATKIAQDYEFAMCGVQRIGSYNMAAGINVIKQALLSATGAAKATPAFFVEPWGWIKCPNGCMVIHPTTEERDRRLEEMELPFTCTRICIIQFSHYPSEEEASLVAHRICDLHNAALKGGRNENQ